MWSTLWFNRNLAKGSEGNVGPLSAVKHLGVPYCEKSCVNLHITVSAVFVDIIKVNWYLLNVLVISQYSLFLNLQKVISDILSRGFWYIPWDHQFSVLGNFVLCICFAAFDVFSYICIYPRPIQCGSCSVLYLFYS